jgi:hypothetical protein
VATKPHTAAFIFAHAKVVKFFGKPRGNLRSGEWHRHLTPGFFAAVLGDAFLHHLRLEARRKPGKNGFIY